LSKCEEESEIPEVEIKDEDDFLMSNLLDAVPAFGGDEALPPNFNNEDDIPFSNEGDEMEDEEEPSMHSHNTTAIIDEA
jgi:hypothetical protein